MKHFTGVPLLFAIHAFCALPMQDAAASLSLQPAAWHTAAVHHAYGLPDIHKDEKGSLTLEPSELIFLGKERSAIPVTDILAVSSGNQRVELWGMKGRLLRMAIPNGGGIAAAGFMHHRVDMLTIEFADSRGAYHAAVFNLAANEAEKALQSIAANANATRKILTAPCTDVTKPGSILVSAPSWEQATVPAAYRALVYEHLVDRLQHQPGVTHVFREGEPGTAGGCPQFRAQLSITAFREGSQVKRAVMGPIGMFVGTTQMTFHVVFTDLSGTWNSMQDIKSTVRGESESMGITDSVAKSIAKHYANARKEALKQEQRAALGK